MKKSHCVLKTCQVAELAKLNLSLNGAAEQYTDDQGYAVFEFSYNYDAQSTEQKPLALKGVALLATANGKRATHGY